MAITADKFREITKGHFFTVTFVKKGNGEIRVMNGLDRVKSYVKGTGRPITDGRVIIWDRKAFRENLKSGLVRFEAGHKAFRSLYPESILTIKVGHQIFDHTGKEISEEEAKKMLAEAQGF